MFSDLGALFVQSRPDARRLVANKPGYCTYLTDGLEGSLVEARVGRVIGGKAVFDRTQTARRYRLLHWHPKYGYCRLQDESVEAKFRIVEVEDVELFHLLIEPVPIRLVLGP